MPFAPIFTNTSTGAASSFWSFGDGGNSALTNPSHSYNILGNYAVKLVVTGANGCKDSITKANFILIHKPHATFTVDKNKGCAPVFVNFKVVDKAESAVKQEEVVKSTLEMFGGKVVKEWPNEQK